MLFLSRFVFFVCVIITACSFISFIKMFICSSYLQIININPFRKKKLNIVFFLVYKYGYFENRGKKLRFKLTDVLHALSEHKLVSFLKNCVDCMRIRVSFWTINVIQNKSNVQNLNHNNYITRQIN